MSEQETVTVGSKVRVPPNVTLELRDFQEEGHRNTYIFMIAAPTEEVAREAAERFSEDIEWMTPDA